MTTPTQIICRLRGHDSEGTPSEETVACRLLGRVRRSVGLNPDQTLVLVKRGSIPGTWDTTRTVNLEIGHTDGETESVLTLGGYVMRRTVGQEYGTPVGGVTPDFTASAILLETIVGELRDGRGGLLTVGTLNPLLPDGEPDDEDPRYKTNKQLVEIALGALGLPFAAVPAAIDTAVDGVTALTPPGPLDWSCCRAMPELDAVLARIGWTATLAIDGSEIRVHRLRRSGETVELPTAITDHAEPFELASDRAVRGSTIVVTSGRTRSTVLTARHLDSTPPLEWVAHDTRTGRWMNNAEWAAAYPSEDAPIDIDAWREGPPTGDTAAVQAWQRMYTAVRLTGADVAHAGRIVAPTTEMTEETLGTLGRTACIAYAAGCAVVDGSQLRNVPADDEDAPVRLDGTAAVAGEGVFVLPPGMFYTRLEIVEDKEPESTYSRARELEGEELRVVFAHEADTGDVMIDHYVSVWRSVVTEGVLSVERVTDEEEIEAALADAATVKVEAPFLRRLLAWPLDEETGVPVEAPTPLNDEELDEAAERIALMRIGDDALLAGTVEMRGLHAVEPGDAEGAVSAVEWDLIADRTIVHVMTHESPYSEYDSAEMAARRSVAAGLGRLSMPGSSAAIADVRLGTTPGDATIGGGGGSRGAEGQSGSRGKDRAIVRDPIRPAPAPAGSDAQVHASASTLWARITGYAALGETGHQWTYEWELVYWDGGAWVHDEEGWTSEDKGPARNLAEHGNPETGLLMIGIDTANLTGTFELQPVPEGRVVRLHGPTAGVWWFNVENHVDGGCGEEVTFT